MTIEKLSPDEIKELLGQKNREVKSKNTNSLSQTEMEALTELMSVSLGGAAAVISPMFNESAKVTSPRLAIIQREKLFSETVAPFFIVLGEYTGDVKGIQLLSINQEEMSAVIELMDEYVTENKDKQFEVVQNFIQHMFESVSSSLATILECEVTYSLSGMDSVERHEDFRVANFTREDWFIEVAFGIAIGSHHKLNLHLCIPVQLAKQMIGTLADTFEEEDIEENQEMSFSEDSKLIGQETSTDVNNVKAQGTNHKVQNVQFSSFDHTESTQSEPNNLNMLLDIPLQVTVELGRTKRIVKEILEISQGSIIELDKLAGEPVDILVNNKLIAVGEVVVIDENFGVRVTDVLSTAERISKLR
ncbi:flagellar motor switch protein FliN [Planococcus sp. PAMC 21323]|uniref:flagellar motor switch phosphatase FliY n=1 Tax=Planococcus sp. PAMC 21323 TaxID=1526927 RepID=UPI00056DFBE6|nr:flagellar motor switch phosphatase FliY [Planococcus sp. PAMC 21323]AIY04101.1 flagellar motor switch protein FliN [Planococcus sp. PAMC 21323]